MTHLVDSGRVVDIDVALTYVDGDLKLLVELVAIFLQDYARLIGEARSSIPKGDHSSLERAAHTLKGRLAFFGVQRGHEQLVELETMGRTHDLARAGEVLAQVEAAMEGVLPELESLVREQSS